MALHMHRRALLSGSLLLAVLLLVLPAVPAWSAETAGEWLDVAADPTADSRTREFAARRLIMLADQSASILLDTLRDANAGGLRRQVAAKVLAEMPSERTEGALLEAAFGQDYFLAEAAGIGLARLYSRLSDGELYSLLTKGTRERNFSGNSRAGDDWIALSLDQAGMRGRFQALVMRGVMEKYARSSDVLLPEPLAWCVWDALISPEQELRLAAVRLAPRVGTSQAPERVAGLLFTENDQAVLIAALQGMALMRPPGYGEAVRRHVNHGDPLVSLEALAAMDAMGFSGVLFPAGAGDRTVAGYVTHPSTPVRRRAIEILSSCQNPMALDPLEEALFDRVWSNRALAARGLGKLGFTAAVGMLSPLQNDSRPEVRAEAAVALSRLGVVGVASRLITDLRDGSIPFKMAAAEALGRIGDRQAVPALAQALLLDNEEVVCRAAEALARIGDASCLKNLTEAITENVGKPAVLEVLKRSAEVFQISTLPE